MYVFRCSLREDTDDALLHASRAENALFGAVTTYENDRFTKTGSGQTSATRKTRGAVRSQLRGGLLPACLPLHNTLSFSVVFSFYI
jgi:hypothetical protein